MGHLSEHMAWSNNSPKLSHLCNMTYLYVKNTSKTTLAAAADERVPEIRRLLT